LILEIHESALAKPALITSLRGSFDRIDVGLAYDDFGAGQARLIELAEAPPYFLKFDGIFISDIAKAPASKRRLLASLVAAARELLVETVAKGIESGSGSCIEAWIYPRPRLSVWSALSAEQIQMFWLGYTGCDLWPKWLSPIQ
jgi:predicted signal transduction protein with EAL and GGDEF domain